jgi:hypothetical protein
MVITRLSDSALQRAGARQRAGDLLKQAGFTMALVGRDAQVLQLLGREFLDDLAKTRADLERRVADGTIEDEMALAQGDMARLLRVWLRQVLAFAARMGLQGQEVPEVLRRGEDDGGDLDLLRQEAERRTGILEGLMLDEPHAARARELAAEGRTLVAELSEGAAPDEHVPDELLEQDRLKGLLYTGLKAINTAAQEAYAEDAERAARYNLSILYRRSRKR